MHFWIDKRSSQLHNFGGGSRGRIPGPGGFYSRTFGTRHNHHPRPSSSSSSSNNANNQNPIPRSQNNNTNASVNLSNHNSTTLVPGQNNHFVPYHHNHQHAPLHLSMNPMDNVSVVGSGHLNLSSRQQILHGMRHNVTQPNHSGNQAEIMNFIMASGSDPVIGLSSQYYHPSPQQASRGGIGSSVPSSVRRARSHSHSANNSGGHSNRRRSSSFINNHQRRSSENHRQIIYDPYNISQNQQMTQNQAAMVWPDNRSQAGFLENNSSNMSSSNHNNGIVLNHHHHHNHRILSGQHSSDSVAALDGSISSNSSFTTTSTESNSDPAYKRTKRIGLTLCFLSFILLSTVAAKFLIEAPWLIDKTPRNERTEATIYFFLTEVIFIAFAVCLFMMGVTCLRKRTNAYLLRQFNDYIMHTSPPPVGGRTSTGSNVENNGVVGNSGGSGLNSSQNNHRPFLGPHFLPPYDSHMINMHISAEESSNFIMNGLSKPPPYHIALYLPIPDSGQCEGNDFPSPPKPEETPTTSSFLDESNGSSSSYQHQHPHPKKNPKNSSNSRPSSTWITTSFLDSGNNPPQQSNNKTDDDSDSSDDDNEGQDHNGQEVDGVNENEEEEEEGRPSRKKRKKANKTVGSVTTNRDLDRAETPPPPYGHV